MSSSSDVNANNGDKDIDLVATLDDFSLWSTVALKSFLSLRKKPITGSFKELAARAYTAYMENTPVDSEAEHRERSLLIEYRRKLTFDDEEVLPDPIDLKSDWLKEVDGMKLWPRLNFVDISRYYADVVGKNNDLHIRIENDYKQKKAYLYYTNNFVNEVLTNNNENSKYCILKTQCMPSQRVRQKAYTVWVVLRKDEPDRAGGEIMSAYCTCTAGLLGSCNHVAGLLFRIEAAVLTGVAHPTCTDVSAYWNVPTGKKQIVPDRITSFVLKHRKYLEMSTQETVEELQEKSKMKRNFKVMSDSQYESLQQGDTIRNEFYNENSHLLRLSCFSELMSAEKQRKIQPPLLDSVPTLVEFTNVFIENSPADFDVGELVKAFPNSLSFDENQINNIYAATVDQANSDVWSDQRKGRITASKYKQIYNCAEKLYNNQASSTIEPPEYLIEMIMGYDTNNSIQTWQMKHGISNEVHAKNKFVSIFKRKHSKISTCNPGMYVCKEFPYLSATPDLEVSCLCHGPGLVEIKCPASLIGKVPDETNYKHLKLVNGELTLNTSSEYYYQVQGQMALSNRAYCYFFVFTFQGNATVRVEYDYTFWSRVVTRLVWFWKKFVVVEMITKKIGNRLENCYGERFVVKRPNLEQIKSEPVNIISFDENQCIDFVIESDSL